MQYMIIKGCVLLFVAEESIETYEGWMPAFIAPCVFPILQVPSIGCYVICCHLKTAVRAHGSASLGSSHIVVFVVCARRSRPAERLHNIIVMFEHPKVAASRVAQHHCPKVAVTSAEIPEAKEGSAVADT